MHYSNKSIRKLLEAYREIAVLNQVSALLSWDMNVNLPEKGSLARAEQSASITSLISDRWLDPSFRKLFEKLYNYQKNLAPAEKATLRNMYRSAKYYYRVPKSLVVEFSKASSEAFMIWQKAKKENDFASFRPALEKNVRLNQMIAEHLGYEKNPYDALLDLFEPGLTTAFCKKLFSSLTKKLPCLVKQIQKSKRYVKRPPYVGEGFHYPQDRQEQLSHFMLRRMGYDLKAGRMDVSAHPFTIDIAQDDVRITTWYNQHDLRSSLMAAMHEGGHGLYEQGVDPSYEYTPMASGVSLGIHESQSRFWENQVGRHPAALAYFLPVFQSFYPEHLADARANDLVLLFNHVAPSLIRVEADEVTYNLHIALRFELEEALISARIKAQDVREMWRTKMKKYLGIVPKTDREGVLQDVHWSYGNFGYFPTYTLGNLYAAQFTEAMKKDLPFEKLLAKGEFGTILSWFRDNIHCHGSRYLPKELSTRISGKPLDVNYFIRYVEKKYKGIYGV